MGKIRDIQDFLGMFQGVRRSGGQGQWIVKCPCHQDDTASLCIAVKETGDGKRRILLDDKARCNKEDIIAALGLTFADLILDPDPDWKPGKGRGGSAGGRGNKTSTAGSPPPPEEPEIIPGMTVHTVGENANEGDKDGQDPVGGSAGRSSSAPGTGSGAGGADVPRGGADGTAGNGEPGTDVDAQGNAEGRGRGRKQDPSPAVGMNGTDAGKTSGAATGGKKDSLPPPQIDWEHPDRIYSYTDAAGAEVFQVVRYHYTNAKGKTFRQRMRATAEQKKNSGKEGWPKVTREGWINSVPQEIRDRYLYRLPKVLEAIGKGEPVYLVEGEKDVETMEAMGHTATCNPGGAGKWSDGYTKILTGADVIILPDNDPRGEKGNYPGQDHAWRVAMKMKDTAKRVRIVNLKEACPDLPDKGDISDMVAVMGSAAAMEALARQVAITKTFTPQMVPFWLTPAEQAARLYRMIGSGFDLIGGKISQHQGDAIKELADFYVIPRMELMLDDGQKSEMQFVLDGWTAGGRKLNRLHIAGSELDNMGWVTTAWGFDAALMPGTTVKNKVSWAIKKVGQMTAQRVTQYQHAGWRQVGGKWCYLYQGGAIGAEGIRVELGGKDNCLAKYRLDGSGAKGYQEITFAEGCRRSLKMLEVMKKDIAIALLGFMYLAPLREWMTMTDIKPSFSLFLYGITGAHKSTAAALGMSHFGNFSFNGAPTNFESTGNSIRELAFSVKDMPLWVDDFHPETSIQKKRQMNATAQMLCRAFGDSADRGRLNADRSVQETRPPRAIAMITGEQLPEVGASGLARFFIVDVEKGDVEFTKEFNELQEDARMGYLQKAMRGYITWLAKQTETLPETVRKAYLQNRDAVRARNKDGHDRAPEAVACILTGYQFMLQYMKTLGLIDQKQWGEMMLEALKSMCAVSEKQTKTTESEKPTQIFLTMLTELMRSKQAGVRDLTIPGDNGPNGLTKMIGYRDREYYYLLPEMSHSLVSQLCRTQGVEFPVSLKALYKNLRTDGILPPMDGSGNTYTRMKWVDGKATRLLWIPAEYIDGKAVGAEQMAMRLASMAQAVDVDLPEAFREKKEEKK